MSPSPTNSSSAGDSAARSPKAHTPKKGAPTPARQAKRGAGAKGKKAKAPKPPRPTTASIAEERALAQARAKERRALNDAALIEHFATNTSGAWVAAVSWLTTAVFVIPTVIATVTNSTSTRHFAAYVSLGLFAASLIVFPAALWIGAQRSRRDEMSMAGWWFLSGSAPTAIKAQLWGSLAVQTIVSIVCASLRFETSIAFGVLVPTLGLSFLGLWGALYGYFPRLSFQG